MKFLLTRELGRLAKWLRLLGFNTVYVRLGNTGSLLLQALREERIILTRNHRFPRSRGVQIVQVGAQDLKGQIREVVRALHIQSDEKIMFSRCVLCNSALVPVAKETIKDKVPEYVFTTQEEFITCPTCNRVYWQGTHWGNVKTMLNEIGQV